jgi:hypothetical protein
MYSTFKHIVVDVCNCAILAAATPFTSREKPRTLQKEKQNRQAFQTQFFKPGPDDEEFEMALSCPSCDHPPCAADAI